MSSLKGSLVKSLYAHFEEFLGAGLLAVMAVLAFLNVMTRYLIQYSFAFTEEIEVALLVWLTMLGAAAGFRRGMHLGFSFLAERFASPARKIFFAAGAMLSMILFTLLLWFSISQIQQELQLQITTEALGIPQWWYTLALPVGSALVIVRIIETTIRQLRRPAD
jgi:TRAP-type C4-dicarboxylate transport system permease small subunit